MPAGATAPKAFTGSFQAPLNLRQPVHTLLLPPVASVSHTRINDSCSLQGGDGSKDGSEAQQHHIGILLFGDSVDYRIARSFCNAALGHGLEHMTDDGIARHHNLTGELTHTAGAMS